MQNQALNGDFSGATTVVIPPAQFTQTPRPRGEEAFASLKKAPGPPATQTGRWRIWTLGFGGYRSLDGDASVGSSSQTTRNYGGSLGDSTIRSRRTCCSAFRPAAATRASRCPTSRPGDRSPAAHLGVYGAQDLGRALRRRRGQLRPSRQFDHAHHYRRRTDRNRAGALCQRSGQRPARTRMEEGFRPFHADAFCRDRAGGAVGTRLSAKAARRTTAAGRRSGPGFRVAHHRFAADLRRTAGRHPPRIQRTARSSRLTRASRGFTSSCPTGR